MRNNRAFLRVTLSKKQEISGIFKCKNKTHLIILTTLSFWAFFFETRFYSKKTTFFFPGWPAWLAFNLLFFGMSCKIWTLLRSYSDTVFDNRALPALDTLALVGRCLCSSIGSLGTSFLYLRICLWKMDHRKRELWSCFFLLSPSLLTLSCLSSTSSASVWSGLM